MDLHESRLDDHSKRIKKLEISDVVQSEKVNRHEIRVNNHSERLKCLENKEAANDVRLANLCDTIEKQTKSITWLTRAILVAAAGFVIYGLRFAIFYGG